MQVANAQTAGAAAALVYDDQINDYFLMLTNETTVSNITVPGMSVPRRVGQLLVSSVEVTLSAVVPHFGSSPRTSYCVGPNDTFF